MSWRSVSSIKSNVRRRCVAFPCKPEALSSAVAAIGPVKTVYYWRERGYCICLLHQSVFMPKLMSQKRMRRWLRYGKPPFFNFLDAPPRSSDAAVATSHFKTTVVREPLEVNAMAQRLAQFRSLSAQILAFEEAVRPEYGDLLLRTLYIQSVENFLATAIPKSRVSVFGSLVSGMWTKGGDLDMKVTFDIPQNLTQNKELKQVVNAPNTSQLQILMKLLRIADVSKTLSIPIQHARVPILRVIHACGLNIDFSFVEDNSRCTSELLRAILEASVCPELQPLSLFLKWHLKHSSGFRVGPGLSGFKLTTLVIFFLQQRQLMPPLQPLIDDLAAGRPLSAPPRKLQPELLGALFRDLLTFIVHLCDQEKVYFDIRTGRMDPCSNASSDWLEKEKSVFVCPEPNNPDVEIMHVSRHVVNQLRKCSIKLANGLRNGDLYNQSLLSNKVPSE